MDPIDTKSSGVFPRQKAIWRESNECPLEIQTGMITTIFEQWEIYGGIQKLASGGYFLDEGSFIRLQHLAILDRMRQKHTNSIYVMSLTYWRKSFLPQDEIYGFMAASRVTITVDYNLHLDEIWPLWYKQSLEGAFYPGYGFPSPNTAEPKPRNSRKPITALCLRILFVVMLLSVQDCVT